MAKDLFRYFRIEARELLEQLGQGVLDLEKETPGPELLGRMLRVAHTLKGAARVVKRQEIANGAHAVEDVLTGIRDKPGAVPRARIDLLLELLDGMTTQLASLTPTPPAEGATAPPVNQTAPEEIFRAFRPGVHEMDGLLQTMAEVHSHLVSLSPQLKRLERARHLADLVVDHLDALADGNTVRMTERVASQRARGLAEELRTTFGTLERDLVSRVDYISREFREARSAAERLRLVPASALFTLLERTARDAGQALGKRVVFEGRGGDVRVDVQILGVVQSALLQLVRNAVAHGIEAPADRLVSGKTPEGHVTLDVVRRGQRLVFECGDDGRGIDFEAVRALAQSKGMAPESIAPLRPEELLALLMKGGISTSNAVTDVSGRGIGLDVVREASERLGGQVNVKTDAGRGTTIDISVPFTLASLPALRVEAAGLTTLIPLDAVRGSFRLSREAIVRTGDRQRVIYDGETVALATLSRALAADSAGGRPNETSSAVVLHGRAGTAAFSVDRVLGISTVVMQPLPGMAVAAAIVAGASIDEEGVPRLVLDPEALITWAEQAATVKEEVPATPPTVLVIDDSLTTRMLEQSILESAGYPVELAVSGEEGLRKALETRYSLFLVDVEMPGMDGFTFIERTKAEPTLRDIPAILVTSRNAPDDRRRGQEVGASAYVVKGEFDQGVLLERIRGLVG